MDQVAVWLVAIAPPLIRPLLLILLERIATFPALKLDLMHPEELSMSGGRHYLHYNVKVKNQGNGVARRCWPQLLCVIPYDGAFSAQAIRWEQDLAQYDPSPREVSYIDIPPKDQTNEFVVVYTDALNPATADVPIARQGARVPTLVLFEPGKYVIRVTVVGNNFTCRPITLQLTLRQAGDRTWETLQVEEWTWSKRLGAFLRMRERTLA